MKNMTSRKWRKKIFKINYPRIIFKRLKVWKISNKKKTIKLIKTKVQFLKKNLLLCLTIIQLSMLLKNKSEKRSLREKKSRVKSNLKEDPNQQRNSPIYLWLTNLQLKKKDNQKVFVWTVKNKMKSKLMSNLKKKFMLRWIKLIKRKLKKMSTLWNRLSKTTT